MNNDTPTLLEYRLGEGVRAFSTERGKPEANDGGDGFNVTHYCGDDPAHVARCRAALCAELGIADDRLLLPRQVHETRLLTVDDDFLKLPATDRDARMDGVDALLTDLPHVCIGVSTADCIPLLLFDPEHRAVAAVHAGWRGTVKRIATLVVEAMRERYDIRPECLRAVIGPGISLQAFEVGLEVYEAFRDAGFPMKSIAAVSYSPMPCPFLLPTAFRFLSPFFARNRKNFWHIDLRAANSLCLEESGVPRQNIQTCEICTYYDRSRRFFSARRLATCTGRIYNGIMLR